VYTRARHARWSSVQAPESLLFSAASSLRRCCTLDEELDGV
jgi:hypothetical protein